MWVEHRTHQRTNPKQSKKKNQNLSLCPSQLKRKTTTKKNGWKEYDSSLSITLQLLSYNMDTNLNTHLLIWLNTFILCQLLDSTKLAQNIILSGSFRAISEFFVDRYQLSFFNLSVVVKIDFCYTLVKEVIVSLEILLRQLILENIPKLSFRKGSFVIFVILLKEFFNLAINIFICFLLFDFKPLLASTAPHNYIY